MARLFLAFTACLLPALLLAQTERVTVRMSPAPNQTLRQRTTQVMAMTAEPGVAGALPFSPQAINMTMTLEITFTVGPADEQGRYDARVVCDTASATATLNGRPMPMPQLPTATAPGQVFTFHYDDQGQVIDVHADGAPAGAAVAPLKQMLASALNSAAPITLSVGETVTLPAQLNLPLPAGGPLGAMTMAGDRKYTLTSITFEGADRIAHLAMKMTGTMNGVPAPGSGSTMPVETRLTSEGEIDVNIDRGIVIHDEQRMTIDTSTQAAASAAMPSIRTHGTVTSTTDLVR